MTLSTVETTFPVRYAETDAMRIVHHSVYLVWFEEGRSAWFRSHLDDDRGFALLEADGYFFAVTEVQARYRAPARYGDRVKIKTRLVSARSRMFTMAYQVYNAPTMQLLAEAQTTHICVNRQGRAVSLPDSWITKLSM